jgi:hypothetical protein
MRSGTFVRTLGLAVFVVGCGSNSPATQLGTGGAPGTGGASVAATGGSASGAGGSAPAGTGGSAPAGYGGSAATGNGGSTGTTTVSGTGGSAPAIDGGSSEYSPSCTGLTTEAGAAPTKSGACTANDPQLCYKTCGPESKGFKSETCTAGAYAEESGCHFPTSGNYACYKIPTTDDATCPTTAPKATTDCTVEQCVVCGKTTGYLDSSGSQKTGYCVCPAASASGSRKWTCASSTAWPCPSGAGC